MSNEEQGKSYTIRVPFELAVGREITGLDQPFESQNDGLTIKITKEPPYYILTIVGFQTEEEAKAYFSKVRTGLAWLLLDKHLGFKIENELSEVVYFDNSEEAAINLAKIWGVTGYSRIDGAADNHQAIVFQSDKIIRISEVYSPSIQNTNIVEQILPIILEGISKPISSQLTPDSKLLTAIDLYNAFFFEQSYKARFLTLVMVFEVLMPVEERTKVLVDLIESWKVQVQQEKQKYPKDSDEYHDLKSLERDFLFRKYKSLRGSVRNFVKNTLQRVGNPEALDLAKKAVKIYDQRSELVHTGKLPEQELQMAVNEARELVRLILQAEFEAS